MDLAAIQLQALVRQTQNQYIMAFASKVGRPLIGPVERMETTQTGLYIDDDYIYIEFQMYRCFGVRPKLTLVIHRISTYC
jgi:hypothetical protein